MGGKRLETVTKEELIAEYGENISSVRSSDCVKFLKSIGKKIGNDWGLYSSGRGYLNLSDYPKENSENKKSTRTISVPKKNVIIPEVKEENKEVFNSVSYSDYIPEKNSLFVPFGCYSNLLKIVSSSVFAPIYVVGETGEGKTFMIEQICAKLNREMIKVSCTPETSEEDLLGDYILRDGNMIWIDGPVTLALRRGAVLVLDEIDMLSPDRGAPAIHGATDGSGVYLKKIGKRVSPAAGFVVIATANTKGRGDDGLFSKGGKYIGTSVQNGAFLDRFCAVLEQGFPTNNELSKIIGNIAPELPKEISSQIVAWIEVIRNTYIEGGIEEFISTRTAVNVCKLYEIFGNMKTVIDCISCKYSEEIKTAFNTIWEKLTPTQAAPAPNETENENNESPVKISGNDADTADTPLPW